MNDITKSIRRMIEKECQRNSLTDLCEHWGITCDDFELYLDLADKTWDGENASERRRNKMNNMVTKIAGMLDGMAYRENVQHDILMMVAMHTRLTMIHCGLGMSCQSQNGSRPSTCHAKPHGYSCG